MPRLITFFALLALAVAALPAESVAGWDPTAVQKAQETVADFLEADADLQAFFDSAYAYAVFPSVGKGAMGVGGAYGTGTVFVGGKAAGKTNLKQMTIGFQFGGQAYSEVVFFESKKAFDNFTNGNLKLSAQASAVAATAGAAANLSYSGGVAITTMVKGGLMYEASVGGQHFGYEPFESKEKKQADSTAAAKARKDTVETKKE